MKFMRVIIPGFNYFVGHRFYHSKIILNLAYLIFSIRTKSLSIFFGLTLRYDQRVLGFILCEDSS